jgi:hypothetical protein
VGSIAALLFRIPGYLATLLFAAAWYSEISGDFSGMVVLTAVG